MDGLQWKFLIEMDDLGVPLFSETPILTSTQSFEKYWYSIKNIAWFYSTRWNSRQTLRLDWNLKNMSLQTEV